MLILFNNPIPNEQLITDYIPNADGGSILCVGGFVDRKVENHPMAMTLVNIHYES